MRQEIIYRTIDHTAKLKAEGNEIVFYIDDEQVFSFDIINIWDLVTERMASLSYTTDPRLARRAYAARELNKSYQRYIRRQKYK